MQLPTFGPEFVTYLSYLLVGPVAWGLFGAAVFYGRKRMLLVSRPPVEPVPMPAPSVTILIPAKDEGERIRACVQSALTQAVGHAPKPPAERREEPRQQSVPRHEERRQEPAREPKPSFEVPEETLRALFKDV